MVDLCEAFSTNKKKKELNPGHKFDLQFRSKKDVQTIRIPGGCCKKSGILFPTFTNGEFLRCEEDFSLYQGELKIQMDRCGDFFAIVQTYATSTRRDLKEDDLDICALDPGVRTFQTAVDSKGRVLEFCPGDIGKIYRHCHHMDKLQGKIASTKSSGKCRVKKAWHRSIKRLKDLVSDAHRKVAKFLCEVYDVVFIPVFNTQDMVRRVERKISSKTSRAMLTWSHYRFRQMLKAKAAVTGTIVKEVTEEYTSQTCTRCGNIKSDLGKRKIYECSGCGLRVDRDENGARNILLKSLVEFGASLV